VPRGSASPLDGLRNLALSVFRWRPGAWLLGLLLAVALGRALTEGYLSTRIQVYIHDGGQRLTWRTHQTSVAAVLREAGVELGAEDIVSPELASPAHDGDVIRVLRARQVTVIADGQVLYFQTHAESVGNLLREVDLQLAPRDWLTLNGEKVTLDTPLYSLGETPRSVSSRGWGRLAPPPAVSASMELAIHRAIPIQGGCPPLALQRTL